jgi:elongation factor Ts
VAITAAMVKELRQITSAGMMDCKKALTETDGDMEKAIDLLREKGLAKAAKKADRVAAEGLVDIVTSEDRSKCSIVEVNSETDFVAKNDEFKTFVKDVAKVALNNDVKTVEELLATDFNSDIKVQDELNNKIAKIGENMNIRRFETLSNEGCKYVEYIHGAGKIGVIVELETTSVTDAIVTLGKDVAMQVAAMNPKYVSRDDVDEEFINHEREILKQQALNEGKPEAIVEKMVVGRVNKLLKEVCLLDQPFVKNGDLTVSQLVAEVAKNEGTSIAVKSVVRFEVGEGIEKKEENFADEVAKQLGN